MNENITPLPVAYAGLDLDGEVCGFYVSREQANEYQDAGGIEGLFLESQLSALTARVKELEEALEEIHERLMKCMDDTISAREAYDSFYQDIAMSALNKEPTTYSDGSDKALCVSFHENPYLPGEVPTT